AWERRGAQKSKREEKGRGVGVGAEGAGPDGDAARRLAPLGSDGLFRSRMIASIALSPTPLIPLRPKRTWPWTASCGSAGSYTTENSALERFTSGGRTSTPILPLVNCVRLQSSR